MDIRKFLGGKPSAPPARGPQPLPEQGGEPPAEAARVVQFSRKRARSTEPSPAVGQPAEALPEAAAARDVATAAPPAAAPQQHKAAPLRQLQQAARMPVVPKRPRQLTQMFLDAGQRDFHASRCPQCGLVYSKGEESDERLHASFHASATKGPRYGGGSPQERVVLTDGGRGRVVMLGGGEAARCKKVQELGSFLEEQMGLMKGWLLQMQGTAFLYVSAAKRIQACVVAEPVRCAYSAISSAAPDDNAAAASAASAARPGSSGAGGGRPGVGGTVPRAAGLESRPTLSATLSSGTPGQLDEQQQQQSQQRDGGCGDEGQAGCTQQPAPAGAAAGEVAVGGTSSPSERQALAAGVRSSPPTQPSSMPPPQAQLRQRQQEPPHRAVLLDRRQQLRAVCGVRLVWVSLDARRQGLATKLLDCMRGQFMQGYVVPRGELAFSAPTEEGAALARAYCGPRFLVYE